MQDNLIVSDLDQRIWALYDDYTGQEISASIGKYRAWKSQEEQRQLLLKTIEEATDALLDLDRD